MGHGDSSHAKQLSPHKACHRTEREQIGRLAGWHSSLNGGMKLCVIALVGAMLPYLQYLFGECAILVAIL